MSTEESKTQTLREVRQSSSPRLDWLRKHIPWLVHWNSLFYYGVFVFLIGILWAGFPFFTNSGTQMLSWDYSWQYIPFSYTYWHFWHSSACRIHYS